MTNTTLKEQNIENVIHLYDKSIDKVVRKYVNNEDHEDLKQEIYIKIWKNLVNCREGSSFVNWICTIASNHCKNHLRSNSKFKFIDNKTDDFDFIESIPDDRANNNSDINQEDLQQIILSKVNGLSKKLRDVIVLYDYEDYSYEQIAQELNCPVGTVRSRLFRAREVLRNELAEFLD